MEKHAVITADHHPQCIKMKKLCFCHWRPNLWTLVHFVCEQRHPQNSSATLKTATEKQVQFASGDYSCMQKCWHPWSKSIFLYISENITVYLLNSVVTHFIHKVDRWIEIETQRIHNKKHTEKWESIDLLESSTLRKSALSAPAAEYKKGQLHKLHNAYNTINAVPDLLSYNTNQLLYYMDWFIYT